MDLQRITIQQKFACQHHFFSTVMVSQPTTLSCFGFVSQLREKIDPPNTCMWDGQSYRLCGEQSVLLQWHPERHICPLGVGRHREKERRLDFRSAGDEKYDSK